jgi:hypothetical protein
MKTELGVFYPLVTTADRKRVPHCGPGDGLLIYGKFHPAPLTLRDFEKMIS